MNGNKVVADKDELTPLEERKKRLSFEDFSFRETREKLKEYKISLSDAVIDERRREV